MSIKVLSYRYNKINEWGDNCETKNEYKKKIY